MLYSIPRKGNLINTQKDRELRTCRSTSLYVLQLRKTP